MAPGRVLIVEDDDNLRLTLAEVLADDGHEVRVAQDGEVALGEMAEWDPELIVLDLMMPRMDGYAFRRLQRNLPGAVSTKILVLSAARDVRDAASELEADAWLAKPFGVHEVLTSVTDLLGETG
jgi:two-component system, chemotaxis family, chemotaxis protein CheY